MGLVRCSLCGMTFDRSDPLLRQRQARHESWHDPGSTTYRRNTTYGTVSWEGAARAEADADI